MATDITLDDGNGNEISLRADVVKVAGSDLVLDSASRRGGSQLGLRRALVHDQGDGLTVNFNGDYPGGITLNHVAVITPKPATSATPKLVVKGGIEFEMEEVHVSGRPFLKGGTGPITRVLVDLQTIIEGLNRTVNDLQARIATLESKT